MSKLKELIRFFYRCNKRFIKAMSFIWLFFFLAMFLVKLIFNNSDISMGIFMAFISSMITISAIVPFVSQYAIFPYCISLGLTRRDYIIGSIAFNILFLAVMDLIINIIFVIGGVTSVILTMPGIGNPYTRIIYFGYAAGICCILTFIAAMFYRYGFIKGISTILLLLSPLMLFRNKIFDYFSWGEWGFEIVALVLLVLGLIFSMLSYTAIKKAEIRA